MNPLELKGIHSFQDRQPLAIVVFRKTALRDNRLVTRLQNSFSALVRSLGHAISKSPNYWSDINGWYRLIELLTIKYLSQIQPNLPTREVLTTNQMLVPKARVRMTRQRNPFDDLTIRDAKTPL